MVLDLPTLYIKGHLKDLGVMPGGTTSVMTRIGLKRTITLPLLTFYGLGNILGAGIYVLVGKVAGVAGYAAPLAFLMASVVAGVSAFSYAELAARFPKSAGEAVYLQAGFGRQWLSLLTGLAIALAGMVSAAALARGFSGYFAVLVTAPAAVVITILLVVLGLLALWGIKESLRVAALFTLIEIGGLLLIVWVAREGFDKLPDHLGEMLSLERGAWHGIFIGAFLAFYAYIGFEDMVNVAEEVRQPARTFPPAIGLALLVATVLYILVATVAVLTIPPAALATKEAPLAAVYQQSTGQTPHLISFIGMFAVVNGALIQIIMASRLLYGLSRNGWLPDLFGRVHPLTRTPVNATLLVTITIILMALVFPLERLAAGTSALVLMVFTLVNMALIRIKRKQRAAPEILVVPGWFPWVGWVLSLGLLIFQVAFLFLSCNQ